MTIIISDVNEGPLVNVAAWFGTVVMVLGVCSRIWSKYSVLRKWTLDDSLTIVTMVLGCTMTATLSMAVVNGLGSPQSSLTDHQIVEFQKYGYASQLLYIPALCLTKLTTLVYLRALSPQSSFEMMNTLLEIFITIWGIGAEFAIAFQCQLPSPWAIISRKCFNTATFWEVSGSIDILTDIIIVLLPFNLVWSLQMPWKRKGVVAIAFGSRVLVIPVTAWRIYSLSGPPSPDQTLSMYYGFLTTTIHLNFAIFMACVAFLRPFLENFTSSSMATTIQSVNTSYGKNSKISFLYSTRSERKISLKPSYKMDNLSEVGLNENPSTFGKSLSSPNDSDTNIPSINNDEIHPAPQNAKDHEDLGPLRPDKVLSFSRVRHLPPEENEVCSVEGGETGITRTLQWDIREEYKQARENQYDRN